MSDVIERTRRWSRGGGEPPRKPNLLDRVREAVRTRHYSRQTEKAYVAWIKRFVIFHDMRHPETMALTK
jgi:hypothetical protein